MKHWRSVADSRTSAPTSSAVGASASGRYASIIALAILLTDAFAIAQPAPDEKPNLMRETVLLPIAGTQEIPSLNDELVEAMQKFIDDPTLVASMGQRSRKIAEEKYDVHKVNAVMLREMGVT